MSETTDDIEGQARYLLEQMNCDDECPGELILRLQDQVAALEADAEKARAETSGQFWAADEVTELRAKVTGLEGEAEATEAFIAKWVPAHLRFGRELDIAGLTLRFEEPKPDQGEGGKS